MKAQAHSLKPGTGKARRLTPSPVETKSRGKMGNHSRLRKDKYELQADEAVERIFRGETGVARRLTPVSAASLKVPTSSGERLAAGMRESLETAFGADFSGVRVHVGQEADTVARQEGAAAFTSGLDIYFASGEYRPAVETGQRLLAHELAHVIQQTGRVASGGQMRATDVRGSGEIQRQAFPEFSRLTKLHEPKEEKEKTKYKKVADTLSEIVKNKVGWTSDAVIASQIEDFKKKPPSAIKDWPAEAESLLYDSLKAVGKIDAAISLIKRDNFAGGARIKTVLFVEDVGDYFIGDVEAAYASFSKHPLVKGYWAEFWRITKLFLFQPLGNSPPVLYGYDENKKLITFKDYKKQFLKDTLDPEKVTDNEWAYYGLEYLELIDDERLTRFKKIQSDAPAVVAKRKGLPESLLKQYYAQEVVAFGKDIEGRKLVDPAKSKVAEPFYRRTGEAIIKIGEDALKIWSRVFEIERNRSASYHYTEEAAVFAADPIKEFAGLKSLSAPFKGFRTHLVRLALALFKPGKGKQRLPSVAEYVGRTEQLADALRAYSRKELEQKQAQFFIQGKTQEVIGLTLLADWAYRLAQFLSDAGKEEDFQLVAESEDFRVAHRIRSARRLYALAGPLEWKDLRAEAEKVLYAKEELESQVALISDWEEERDVPIGRLLTDYGPDKTIQNLEPITTRHVVSFFQAQYYEALTAELRRILPPGGAPSSTGFTTKGYVPLLDAAREEVLTNFQKFERPQRWKVKDAEWAIKKPKETDARDALLTHPKTAALIARILSAGHTFFIRLPEHSKEVFLWTFPSFYKLIAQLRTIDLLNLRVEMELAGSGKRTSDLSDKEWLALLIKNVLTKGKEFSDKDREALTAAIFKQQEDAYKRLIPEQRKAFNHHRQVLSFHQIGPMLHLYGQDSNTRFKYYSYPTDVMGIINGFAFSVIPPEDQNMQLAALMLEIAPGLRPLKSERRLDLGGYLNRIEDTEKLVASRREELKREFLPLNERSDAWIDGQLKELAELKPHLERLRLHLKKLNGFRADKDDDVLMNLHEGLSIRPKVDFEANRKVYNIVAVHRSFVYHNSIGYRPPPGKTITATYEPPEVLDENGKNPLVVPPNEVLLVVKIDGEKKEITATQTDLLDELADALDVQTFQLYIGGTLRVANFVGEVLITGAELIPGVGQGVLLAEAATAITSFFFDSDSDYKRVKEFFSRGPKKIIEDLLKDIKNSFTADNMVLFLLLGNTRLDAMVSRLEGKGKKIEKPGRSSSFGKVNSIVEGFHKLGNGLLTVLTVLHERVQVPVKGFQGYVASHPSVAVVLGFAADHLHDFLGTISTLDLSNLPLSKEDLEAMLKEKGEGVVGQVRGIVDGLEHFELPKRVLNTEVLLQFMIAALWSFLMSKMGFKLRLIEGVLKQTGMINRASARIAKELVEAGWDLPNDYWRDSIVPEIQGSFNTTRKEIVESINQVLGGVFGQVSPPTDMSIELEGEGFPETEPGAAEATGQKPGGVQPMPDSDGPLTPDPEDIPSVYGGTPLEPRLRSDLESSYGHDFSHVRLHTDSEAAPMTQAFGAQGLTTGSHVYLKPGLEPDTGRGRDVLQHELVHVLQQTGARPLGAEHSSSPSVGSANKVLNYDPGQEAAASAASAAAPSRARSQGPVPFGQESEGGFQPLLGEFVFARILKTLTDVEEVREEAKTIDKLIDRPKLPTLEKDVETAIFALVRVALRPKDNQTKVTGNDPFKDATAIEHIQSRLTSFETRIRRAAVVLASQSMTHVKDPAPPKGKPGKPKRLKVLNPGPFVHRLEGYIFVTTGIRIVIKRTEAKDSTGSYHILPASNPVQSLEIRGIHLPFILGNSDLWREPVKRKWPGATDKERSELPGDIKSVILAKRLITDVWERKTYTFTDDLKDAVDKYRKTSGGLKLDPAHPLPSWQDYVKPDPPAGPAINDQIGLRIGKYGDETQRGQGRESHHTTQYLLGEYFSNKNGVEAFRARWLYPGVDWKGNEVLRIRRPGAKYGEDSGAIKVKDTETGHGSAMPAILLAAETHEGGKMHVTPEPDDITRTGPSRQGNTVNREFYSKPGMSDIKSVNLTGNKTNLNQYVAKAGQDRVHKDIYNAVQETYRWMREEMLTKFKSSMPGMELDYYKDRYRERNSDELPTPQEGLFRAALEKIPDTAEKNNVTKNNDTRLEALGWHK